MVYILIPDKHLGRARHLGKMSMSCCYVNVMYVNVNVMLLSLLQDKIMYLMCKSNRTKHRHENMDFQENTNKIESWAY